MKTIKHPDTYMCEICGKEYAFERAALICESSPRVPTPVHEVGDTIKVQGKWGVEEAIIINMKIEPTYVANVLHDTMEVNIERFIQNRKKIQTHTTAYYLDREIEVARGSYTNVVNDVLIVQNKEE